MNCSIAIIGATGLVGRTAIQILNEKNLTNFTYTLYASKKSANKKLKIGKQKLIVKELNNEIFKQKFNYAIFCTKEAISKTYIQRLAKKGTKVIDCSSYFRHQYPIIVPEINFSSHQNIICNPNCSTASAVMCLHKIAKNYGLKHITFSTYQAVSGAGKLGIKDLRTTNENHLKKFDYLIRNNVIPYIGKIDKHGYSTEENKMIYETKKILNLTTTTITATCMRVPVKNCHTISINFQTEKPCKLCNIISLLLKSENVRVLNDANFYPMPIIANNQNEVFVGRIRVDSSMPNSFNMVVVADNLRKGAALNAIQILEALLKEDKWI